MSNRRLFVIALVLNACTDNGSQNDAGPDATNDTKTVDVASDTSHPDSGGADVHADSPNDVSTDVNEAGDASDAGLTDATDGGVEAGSSWHTPTCDGVISTGEYGTASNQTTSSSQTWYMTWDATNLYLALDTATLTEANVLYVGFTGSGLKTGQVYDSTGGTLPFAADGVVYAKSGYEESRTGSADAGAWSAASPGTVTFCGSGTTREEVIPWTALGATSIPASFRFLAYATSGSGFVYGQIPTTNPGGNIGTTATFAHDFYVASTANGTGSFPFDTVE
jgi:hypothetical protein